MEIRRIALLPVCAIALAASACGRKVAPLPTSPVGVFATDTGSISLTHPENPDKFDFHATEHVELTVRPDHTFRYSRTRLEEAGKPTATVEGTWREIVPEPGHSAARRSWYLSLPGSRDSPDTAVADGRFLEPGDGGGWFVPVIDVEKPVFTGSVMFLHPARDGGHS